MIGLQEYRRDRSFPGLLGDPEVPSEAQLLELVREHLLREGAPAPAAATWVHARWKPGVSTTAGFEVEFAEGIRRFVGIKRYCGEKARTLATRPAPEVRGGRDEVLLPRAAAPATGLLLWTFPADRQLPGLGRALDLRRTARLIDRLEAFAPLVMRPGPSSFEVLRYKPEHRAVLRLDLRLRPAGGGPRTRARVLVRCLTPDAATALARCREAVGNPHFLPALLGTQPRTGILVEEWLDVVVPDPHDFSHAREAGRVLALLHRAPLQPGRLDRRTRREDLAELFAVAPALGARLLELGPFRASRPDCWVHGDFHPDQVVRVRDSGDMRLLDLDRLALGCAADDLATWIADDLDAHPEHDLERASSELLGGYRAGGGQRLEPGRLAECTSTALVRLAAAGLRRLQEDAIPRAERLLESAVRIASGARSAS